VFSQPLNTADPFIGYATLCQQALSGGDVQESRGHVYREVFGASLSFDLRAGYPLLDRKATNFDAIIKELLWFLRGDTNIDTLGCGIWDQWANDKGDVGPVYGKQWRDFGGTKSRKGVDQVSDLIENIKTNPTSRRHLVSAWNPSELPKMGLPPCHYAFQFRVSGGMLDLLVNQRSADLALGVPFNVASYAALSLIIGAYTNTTPRFLHFAFGSAHLYREHEQGMRAMLLRGAREESNPNLTLVSDDDELPPFDELTPDNFILDGYDPHPPIKFEVHV